MIHLLFLLIFSLAVCCIGGDGDVVHRFVPHSAPQGRPPGTPAAPALPCLLLFAAIHGHGGQCKSRSILVRLGLVFLKEPMEMITTRVCKLRLTMRRASQLISSVMDV